MLEWVIQLLFQVFLTAVLGLLIIVIVSAFGATIIWWAAFLIAAVLVFGGFLFIDGDWIN